MTIHKPPRPSTSHVGISLYSYQATKNDELSFSEGQLVRIVKPNFGGWAEGLMPILTNIEGIIERGHEYILCGWFPTSLVTPCDNRSIGEYRRSSLSITLSNDLLSSSRLRCIIENHKFINYSELRPASYEVVDDVNQNLQNLIADERDFVEALLRFSNTVVFKVLIPLFNSRKLLGQTWFPLSDHIAMFSSIEPLLEFHRKVLSLLETLPNGSVAQAFLSFGDEFENIYTLHCQQISPAIECATRYSGDARMLEFLQVFRNF
jgi:hypothetical protein